LDEAQTQSRSFQIKLDDQSIVANGWYYSILISLRVFQFP
jgi:hypothetical protein